MKKQIVSCALVGLMLFMLFEGSMLAGAAWRVISQVLPGGLVVSYYKGENFESLVCRRTERQAKNNYERGSPVWGMSSSHFSDRWDGFLLVPQDARYQFYLQSKDGSRLYIDDEKIIDRWDQHDWTKGSDGEKQLTSGRHTIRIEHYKGTGEAAVRLRWCGGPIPDNTVIEVPYITKK